jgi:hypothetical protein
VVPNHLDSSHPKMLAPAAPVSSTANFRHATTDVINTCAVKAICHSACAQQGGRERCNDNQNRHSQVLISVPKNLQMVSSMS